MLSRVCPHRDCVISTASGRHRSAVLQFCMNPPFRRMIRRDSSSTRVTGDLAVLSAKLQPLRSAPMPNTTSAATPPVPDYLRDTYTWAYLDHRTVPWLDQPVVVSAFL